MAVLRLEIDLAEGLQPRVVGSDLDLPALRPRLFADSVINLKIGIESLSVFELPPVVRAFSRPLCPVSLLVMKSKLLAGDAEVRLS